MKKLICIYTCEKDKLSLSKFKSTNLYKSLKQNKNNLLLEVYADSETSFFENGKLYLNCKEDYTKLSLKTFKMITKCVTTFDFDVLIKIDCNVLETDKIYGINTKLKQRVFTENFILNTLNSDYIKNEYGGLVVSYVNNTKTLKKWGEAKNVKLNFKNKANFEFPFFCGKFYFLSYNMCEKIIQNGNNELKFFDDNLGPAEDVFIGYILNCFLNTHTKSKILNEYQNYIKVNLSEIDMHSVNTIIHKLNKQTEFEKEHCIAW